MQSTYDAWPSSGPSSSCGRWPSCARSPSCGRSSSYARSTSCEQEPSVPSTYAAWSSCGRSSSCARSTSCEQEPCAPSTSSDQWSSSDRSSSYAWSTSCEQEPYGRSISAYPRSYEPQSSDRLTCAPLTYGRSTSCVRWFSLQPTPAPPIVLDGITSNPSRTIRMHVRSVFDQHPIFPNARTNAHSTCY